MAAGAAFGVFAAAILLAVVVAGAGIGLVTGSAALGVGPFVGLAVLVLVALMS